MNLTIASRASSVASVTAARSFRFCVHLAQLELAQKYIVSSENNKGIKTNQLIFFCV